MRTKTQQRIVEAYERGYGVTECGKLHSFKGPLKVKRHGKQRYPTFSTNWQGVFGVPVHLFAAYVFYGEKAFEEGIVVRHLDGDTENISKSNIVLGTHSENNLDKPKEVRIAAAKKARAAQGKTPKNAKLSLENVKEIREIYKNRGGVKMPNGFTSSLADKFGVSKTIIHKVVKGEHYAS